MILKLQLYKNLENLWKHVFVLLFLNLFEFEVLESIFSICLTVWYNLYEVFGCTVLADFLSTMFEVSKVFDW